MYMCRIYQTNMELDRLKEEYDKLKEFWIKFQPAERQPQQEPEELQQEPEELQQQEPQQQEPQEDKTTEKKQIIIQMAKVQRKMIKEQKQKNKELGKEKEATEKDVLTLIQAAKVIEKIENDLKKLEQIDIKTELTKLKQELHHLEIFKLIIKQITQEEIQKQILKQVDKQLKEAEIKKEVEKEMTDDKIHQLLKPILEHQIDQIKQLLKEEFKEDTTATHEQQLMTELILRFIRKIEPKIPYKWKQNKNKWIQDQVKEEIKRPKLEIQPQRIHDIKKTIKDRRNEQKHLVKDLVKKLLHQKQTNEITCVTSSDDIKLFTDEITKVQQHKYQLQQIEQRLQQIKSIKEGAEKIQRQLEAPTCTQVALAKLQEDAKELEQQAQQKEWDEYYMKIACLAALRSKDPRKPVSSFATLHSIIQCHTQVGACVVDRKKEEIVGIGYNSMPYVEDDDNDTVFPWKDKHENEEEHNKHWQVHPELKHAYGN